MCRSCYRIDAENIHIVKTHKTNTHRRRREGLNHILAQGGVVVRVELSTDPEKHKTRQLWYTRDVNANTPPVTRIKTRQQQKKRTKNTRAKADKAPHLKSRNTKPEKKQKKNRNNEESKRNKSRLRDRDRRNTVNTTDPHTHTCGDRTQTSCCMSVLVTHRVRPGAKKKIACAPPLPIPSSPPHATQDSPKIKTEKLLVDSPPSHLLPTASRLCCLIAPTLMLHRTRPKTKGAPSTPRPRSAPWRTTPPSDVYRCCSRRRCWGPPPAAIQRHSLPQRTSPSPPTLASFCARPCSRCWATGASSETLTRRRWG